MLERPALPQGIVRTREPCSTFFMDGLDGFIGTFSGLRFWPLDPDPDKILIEDIAHALAHQCRFGGHASKFYSVAEHSVHVSKLCAPKDALWGLLHDASEAYCGAVWAPARATGQRHGGGRHDALGRSEEHTSELQSLR